MNPKVRKLLIEKASLKNVISYTELNEACNLNLNLTLANDRKKIGEILSEIGKFEYEHNRPIITAIVTRKNEPNKQGDGFYKLCEDLNIGNENVLSEQGYGIKEMVKSWAFWSEEDNYVKHYNIKYDNEKHLDFFNVEELNFFFNWSDKVYDKTNLEHVTAKNYLMETVWKKTVYWSNKLVSQLDNFETYNPRMWSKMGWDTSIQPSVQVARFKEYTWARIYKKGDENKDIFFTVGVDVESQCLLYKLDYFFQSGGTLTDDQKELCNQHIPELIKWVEIPLKDVPNWNWDDLLLTTQDFIRKNEKYYDLVVKIVWEGHIPTENPLNSLILTEKPLTGQKYNPEKRPSFKGVEVDFIEEQINNKEIGNAGETLVLEWEKKALGKAGFIELANKVRKVKDGEGYDILSYFNNGQPKYIEVKTTTSNDKTTFDISKTEVEFSDLHTGSYFIYRLYNYDEERNTANYFIIDNLREDRNLQPTSYRAYFKN